MLADQRLPTQQLTSVQPHLLIVTPLGGKATFVPNPVAPPLDVDDLSDAAGGKGK